MIGKQPTIKIKNIRTVLSKTEKNICTVGALSSHSELSGSTTRTKKNVKINPYESSTDELEGSGKNKNYNQYCKVAHSTWFDLNHLANSNSSEPVNKNKPENSTENVVLRKIKPSPESKFPHKKF